MSVGTSHGAFFDDAFQHFAGVPTIPKGDEDLVKKPVDTGDDNVLPPDEGSYDNKSGITKAGLKKVYVTGAPPELQQYGHLNTPLTDEERPAFDEWKAQYAPNDSGEDYDLQGAFKAGVTPAANGHMPDTFKKPNHPTFSDQSKFAKDYPDLAGSWDGDEYHPAPDYKNPPEGNMIRPFIDRFKNAVARPFQVVNDVLEGRIPMNAMDPDTGEWHTSLEGMKAAWELAPLALSGAIPSVIHLRGEGVKTLEKIDAKVADRVTTPDQISPQQELQEMMARIRRQPSNIEPPTMSAAETEARRFSASLGEDWNRVRQADRERYIQGAADTLRQREANPYTAQEPYEPHYPTGRVDINPGNVGPNYHLRVHPDRMSDAEFYHWGEYQPENGMTPAQETRWTRIDAEQGGSLRPQDTLVDRSHSWEHLEPESSDPIPKQWSAAMRSKAEEAMKGDKLQLFKDKDRSRYGDIEFKFASNNGVGKFDMSISPDKKHISIGTLGKVSKNGYIDWEASQEFGFKDTRDLLRALMKEFPKAETISGFRISGARQHANATGTAFMRLPRRGPVTDD